MAVNSSFRIICTVIALVIVLATFLPRYLSFQVAQIVCSSTNPSELKMVGFGQQKDSNSSQLLLEAEALLLKTQQDLLKAEEQVLKTQQQLEQADATIAKLTQEKATSTSTTQNGGCQAGALKKLHQHMYEIVRYFERTLMDYHDDTRRAAENAQKAIDSCQDPVAVEGAKETIHWYRFRNEPDYGNPMGRKPYFSGEGEGGIDRMVEIFVDGKENGVFLELGGLTGREGNTRYFDEFKNWTGIMFEAGKGNWELGKVSRPRIPFHRVALWNQTGKLVDTGTYQHMRGDVAETAGAGLVAVCAPLAPGEAPPQETDEIAPCHSIDYLLAGGSPVKEGFGAFDYVGLDCEGCEIHVVEKWDFQRNPSKVFTIENHGQMTPPPKWRRIVQIMRENGYVWMFTFFDGFFLNTRLLYGIEPDAFGYRTFWDNEHAEWTARRRLARKHGAYPPLPSAKKPESDN